MNRPERRLVPVCLAAALSLTACGSGHPSGTATQGPQAADLYAAARRSAVSATSAHVTGSSTTAGVTSTIDLVGNRSGSNSRVVLRTGDEGPVEIRVVDGATYLKGDSAYWTKQADARTAAAVAGRFVRLRGDQVKAPGLTLSNLLDRVFTEKELGQVDTVNAAVGTATVDGRRAYVLTQRVGGDGARISVSADSRHDLLRVDGTTRKPGTMHFSQWNAAPTVTAPADDQVAPLPSR
jgi:hypothetical protein